MTNTTDLGELPEVTVTAAPASSLSTASPYAVRAINLTIQLGTGSFGSSGENTVTLTGLRVIVQVEQAALPTTGMATVRVYGITLSMMNTLSRAGLVWQDRTNKISIQAGDNISGMATIFNGQIIEAYPDFSQMPNSAFVMICSPTTGIQLKPVVPSSYPGQTSASSIFQQLAKQAGLQFENNGVNTMLASPYLPGTVFQQIQACARAANCFACVDSVANTLAIWPKTGNRSGSPATISPQTGMIGYPTFQQRQIIVRTLFDPSVTPSGSTGKQVTVQSQLASANGNWTITRIDYNLASQMPDGPWEMTITGSPANQGNAT